MEFVNAIYTYFNKTQNHNKLLYDCVKDVVLLIAPLTPHFAEELNERMGSTESVFNMRYPVCDEKALVKDEVEIAVQINSKIKGKATVSTGASDEEVAAAAKEAISETLGDTPIKKTIVIKGRLVNFIV